MIIDYKSVIAKHRNLFPRVVGFGIILQAVLVIGFYFLDGGVGWWALIYAAVSLGVAYLILVTFPEFFMVEGGRVFVRQFRKKKEIDPGKVPGITAFKVVNVFGKQFYGHRFKSEDEYFEVIYLGEEKPEIIRNLTTAQNKLGEEEE